MKFNLRFLLLISAVALATMVTGCATVCDTIRAEVPAVNAKLADAQRALAEVEKSGIRDKLSGKALETFDEGMRLAKEGYTLAVQSTALASEACKDNRNYLDMIVRGWTLIRPFLALIGGEGTAPIADPIVWTEQQ
jgi:hypothetical protein